MATNNIDHPFNDETSHKSPSGSGADVVTALGVTPGFPEQGLWKLVTSLDPTKDYSHPLAGAVPFDDPPPTWSVDEIEVIKGQSYFFLIWFKFPTATGVPSYKLYLSSFTVRDQGRSPTSTSAARRRGKKKRPKAKAPPKIATKAKPKKVKKKAKKK